MALTNLQIKSATPGETDYTLTDGSGLFMIIKPNGSKLWRFRYPDVMNAREGHKVRAHSLFGIIYAAGMMSTGITGYSPDEIFDAVRENMIKEMASNDVGHARDMAAAVELWDYLTGATGRMGAIAKEGNKANLQRGGDESAGWLDMVESGNGVNRHGFNRHLRVI